MEKKTKIWSCKIGGADDRELPIAADWPMRQAVSDAFKKITGRECEFLFSKWGAELTDGEQSVVDETNAQRRKGAKNP